MPTFDTPQPIQLHIDLTAGAVSVEASDRHDTVVEIVPRDPDNKRDVEAAAQMRVDFADGTLTIKSGKRWLAMVGNKYGTVDVTVSVPLDSHVHGVTYLGDLRFTGRLAHCDFKTYMGDIDLTEAESVHLVTSMGRVTVDRVGGHCQVTGTGELRIGFVGGGAEVKNLNGHTWIGTVAGELFVKSANGDISVEHTAAGVTARTAYGRIHIGEIVRGTVVLQSAAGQLDIGIRPGTAAWLDVKSSAGRVRSELDATDQPEPQTETAQIRGRTSAGDIIIRRAVSA